MRSHVVSTDIEILTAERLQAILREHQPSEASTPEERKRATEDRLRVAIHKIAQPEVRIQKASRDERQPQLECFRWAVSQLVKNAIGSRKAPENEQRQCRCAVEKLRRCFDMKDVQDMAKTYADTAFLPLLASAVDRFGAAEAQARQLNYNAWGAAGLTVLRELFSFDPRFIEKIAEVETHQRARQAARANALSPPSQPPPRPDHRRDMEEMLEQDHKQSKEARRGLGWMNL